MWWSQGHHQPHTQYPVPRAEDLFLSLAGGQKSTKLDLSHVSRFSEELDRLQNLHVENTGTMIDHFSRTTKTLPFPLTQVHPLRKFAQHLTSGKSLLSALHWDLAFDDALIVYRPLCSRSEMASITQDADQKTRVNHMYYYTSQRKDLTSECSSTLGVWQLFLYHNFVYPLPPL